MRNKLSFPTMLAVLLFMVVLELGSQPIRAEAGRFQHDLSGNLALRTNSITAEPVFFNRPALKFSENGSSEGFAITVSDPSNVSIQWFFNGANIVGATNANLLLNNVTSSNKGSYSVVVSNASGVVTSTVARLLFNFDQIKVWGDNSEYQHGVPHGINQNASGLVDGSADIVGITAGDHYTFALRTNGSLVGWGQNDAGQASVPSTLTNVAQIVLGGLYHAALKTDGSVFVWGSGSTYGLTTVPAGVSNIVALSMTYRHILALRSDATVLAWGLDDDDQTTVPPLLYLDPVVGIAAGGYHSLALKANGTVVGWGQDDYGQATPPAGLTNVIAVSAGIYHSLALRANGTVVAWGENTYTQTNVPPGLNNVIAISAGWYHNLALRSDGSVVAWGANSFNQTNVPALSSNVVAISAGFNHSVALMGADANELAPTILRNSVWTGVMSNALPSRIYTKNRATTFSASGLPAGLSINAATGEFVGAPTVAGVFNVTITAANSAGTNQMTFPLVIVRPVPQIYSQSSAITYTGHGFNYQTLANNAPTSYSASGLPPGLSVNAANGLITGTPQAVGIFPVVLTAANGFGTGGQFPLSVTVRSVVAWGANSYGQINTPVGLSNIVAVAGGDSHTVVLQTNGTVLSWGYNGYGQVNVPGGLSNVINITAGERHSMALKSDGTVAAWGNNAFGQTNLPASLTNVVAIDSEYRHNIALKADGTVVAWGNNVDGQTNVPGFIETSVAVAAGYYHSLALQANGMVVSWGYGGDGQTNVPAGLSNVVAIAAGERHNLAVRSNGTVVAWGYNNHGQTNVPPGLSNVVAVAGGYRTSFALKSDGNVVAWGFNSDGQTNIPAGLTNVIGIAEGGNHSLALTAGEPGVSGPLIVSPFRAVGALGTPFYYRTLSKNGATIYGASGLPPGLTIHPTSGIISGVPMTNGLFTVTLSAGHSSRTNNASLHVSIIKPLPRIHSPTNALAYVNSGFSYQILANNGATSYAASGLPAWASLDPVTGLITGVPVAPGTFVLTLSANNAYGTSPPSQLTVEIKSSISVGGDNYVKTNGTLTIKTTNSYTFDCTNGTTIVMRSGSSGFTPHMQVYGPDGLLQGSAFTASASNRDVYLSVRATNSGPFTLVVSSYYTNGSGSYALSLGKIPGEFVVPPGYDGGSLINGTAHAATNALGDLDVWSFTANAGESITLRVGTSEFAPRIDLYGPDGILVSSKFTANTSNRDAYLAVRATNSGTFTVVTHSYYYNYSGAYTLHLAKSPGAFTISPGDEGGGLTNGFAHAATNTLGDLDMWSFTASAGDAIVLRMGASAFAPQIDLYGPDGVLIRSAFTETTSNRDAYLASRATNSGLFTVVTHSYYYNYSGTYTLHLAKSPGAFAIAPGDEGGMLSNGFAHPATNTLGDLDMWSFTANAGDAIALRMGASAFTPQIDLYGPDGVLIRSAFTESTSNRDAYLASRATNSGLFTVVTHSYYYNYSGTYNLHLAKSPGAFAISPGDDGGTLTKGINYDGAIAVGDLDLWRFVASKSNIVTLRCEELSGGSSFNPRMQLFGINGDLLATSANATVALITNLISTNGTYTLLVDGGNFNNAGTYRLTVNGITNGLKLQVATFAGTNLIFSAGGGAADSTFVLFTTTNLTGLAGNWTPILTNQFNPSGGFDYTNAYDPNAAQKFFLLQQQ